MARNSPGWTESCTPFQMVRLPRTTAAPSIWITAGKVADGGEVVIERSSVINFWTPYQVAGKH
jgi:hypothetical protein